MKTTPSFCQQKIRVLIADDHVVIREGIRELLRTAPDIEVVGEAGSGSAVITQAYRLCPDVILLDIAMPDINGIAAARELVHRLPRSKIVMLSTYHGEEEVNAALEAGACSYLTKESAGAELIRAVRETALGHPFLSPLISARVFQEVRAHRQSVGSA